MTGRLEQIRAKIDRANKHILEFEERLNAFRSSNPYQMVIETNPGILERIYKIKVVKHPPLELSLITGDAIHNLRSALDHLVWKLIEANGNNPTNQTGFPIFDTLAKYEAKSPAKVKGMSAAAMDLISATKPYKGGTDEIWALHHLNNIDKHHLLLMVGYSDALAAVTLTRGERSGTFTLGMPIQNVILDDGTVIGGVRGTLHPEVKEDLQFAFEIAFREPEIVKGQSVLRFIHQLSQLVDGIVSQFASHL
ncbi:MAG: hypothetical protein IT428_19820 [Planctomycetaceae bacterium]|nr:hypothetical protein [Planctomycetaceae bacterium]